MNTLTLLMTTLLLTSYAKVSSQHISDCILTALKKYFEIQVPKPDPILPEWRGTARCQGGLG